MDDNPENRHFMLADDQDFHVRRAREEIDRSYRAAGGNASRAHMELAALHMAKAREASGGA